MYIGASSGKNGSWRSSPSTYPQVAPTAGVMQLLLLFGHSVVSDALWPRAPLSMGFPRQEYRSGWFAISSSRGSFWPRDSTCISCTGRLVLYHGTTGKPRVMQRPGWLEAHGWGFHDSMHCFLGEHPWNQESQHQILLGFNQFQQ